MVLSEKEEYYPEETEAEINMAHNDIGAPENFANKTSLHKCGSFDRGVVLCKYDRELSDGQSPYIKNMIFDRNMLRTRFGQVSIGTDIDALGGLHSKNEEIFFGSFVFHIGSGLYAFDGAGLRVLSENLPDCDSFIFEMNSMLYIFCSAARVFTVTKDFEVNEIVLEETKLMVDAKYNLSEFSELELPDNMLVYRVSVDYLEREAGIKYYILPCECDENYPVIFTRISDNANMDIGYTVDGTRIDLDSTLSSAYNVSFVPKKGTPYRNFDKIFGCRRTCTYGGNSSGGTRVFFSGNDEYPGYYFYSELLSPMHIKKLSYDILGNGSQCVTCLAKQKDELVVFCENSVYKIRYTFDNDSGASFITSEISTGIGCDIPGSVKLVDNRLVFAKTGSGIYTIVSSEYTDELSIRRISGNINGNEGEGFLYENARELKGSVASDFAGRYMLVSPSGNAYVWDYGNSPYVVYDNPSSSEKKLSWYLFDGIAENSLFEINGALYGTSENGGHIIFIRFADNEGDFGMDITCIYRSREIDNGDEFFKKVATDLYLNAVGINGTNLAVYVLADDIPILYESYTFNERDEDGEKLRRLIYKIPGYSAYKVSVMLICMGGRTGLYDAAIRFRRTEAY